MSSKKVSIIMPVYGVEQYIARAIESVLAQSYANWELIVVNDGTKDRSREIATQYAAKDNRIKIIDKENGGLSDARNVGLKHITGEYVNFFDSDDWVEPDFLKVMIDTIEAGEYDMAACGYYVDIQNNQGKITQQIIRKYIPWPASSVAEYFDLMELYMNFAWNKLYRREFLERNNLEFEKGLWLIEDCEFISRVLACSPAINVVKYAGYHYVQRPEVTLSKKFNSQVIDFIRRKMSLYEPVLKSLGASDEIACKIYEDMRAYSSVYLIKQMIRSLTYTEFVLRQKSLYRDGLLNPKSIRLKHCRNKSEYLILGLTKLGLSRVVYKLGNR